MPTDWPSLLASGPRGQYTCPADRSVMGFVRKEVGMAQESPRPAAWQRRGSELLLDRWPWLRVFQDEVELPNGHRISDWLRLEGRDAVLVFALTREQQVLM